MLACLTKNKDARSFFSMGNKIEKKKVMRLLLPQAFLLPLWYLVPHHVHFSSVSDIRSVVAPNTRGCGTLLSETFRDHHRPLQTIEFATQRNVWPLEEEDYHRILLQDLVEDSVHPPPPPIPRYHALSAHHYQRYQESAYREHFSYSQFCVLEERIADIVFLYLNDSRNRWLVLLDPAFLYSDSVKSYGNTGAVRSTAWISPSASIGDPDFILWKPPSDRPPL